MQITESLQIENEIDRRGYQEMYSDCEAHGLMRSDFVQFGNVSLRF